MKLVLWIFLAALAAAMEFGGEHLGAGTIVLVGLVLTQTSELVKNELTFGDLLAWFLSYVGLAFVAPVLTANLTGNAAWAAPVALVVLVAVVVSIARAILNSLPVLKDPLPPMAASHG